MRSIFTSQRLWSEVRCGKIASGLIQSRRSPKCQNSTEKRQRAPRDLFHPIKSCLGLAIGRLGNPITKQLTADLPKHPSSFHGKLNKVYCVMQAGHEWTWWVWWQDIHLMDLWYFTATSPTWKNLCSIGGKSPYKTIISEHFCGTHTVASLDDLQGFIAEIPPKTMYVKPGPRHHQVVSKKPECFRRFHQPGKSG